MSAPLVMIHGSFGCGSDWTEVLRAMGRTAATPDLPAHGARYGSPAASFAATRDELVRSLPKGCDLVGYSLGGRLALAAALVAPPGTVRSLVLESAHPGLEPAARVLRLAEDRARSLHLRRDPAGFLREFYMAPLFEGFRGHPRFAAVLAERIARAERAPGALASTFTSLSPGYQPDLTLDLLASAIPTLLVVGGWDTKYAQLARRLTEAAPPDAPLDLVEVTGAGHNVHLEKPREYVAAVMDFWEGLP